MIRLLAVALLALSAWLGKAHAVTEVAGVKFADTFEVAQQPLVLNGAGVRVKLVFDIYAASLYLPQRQTTAQGVLTQTGAKSVQAVLLRDLTAEEFVNAMVKGFKANNTPADIERLRPKLTALETLMLNGGSARKGTTVHINYMPGAGTRVVVDGQARGADIPGEDFYQALLRIWLGPKPVDADLKAALLAGH